MLQNYFVAAIGLLSCQILNAQTASLSNPAMDSSAITENQKKESLLSITGSADVYFKYDLSNSSSNGFTSFTQTHNSFAIGMASVKLEHKNEKLDMVADLGFGPRAKDFSYTDEGITQVIKQLYISYSPAAWLKFTAGTWATHIGYEVLDPQLNRNYSMSYLFTNGPFSHTGLKTEITNGKHTLMAGLSNATDYRVVPGGFINKKSFIAQYAFIPGDNFKLYLNYVSGQNPDTSKAKQFDLVLTGKFSDKFNIAINGTLNSTKTWMGNKHADSKSWKGAAIYLNYDPLSWLGISLRNELFDDKNQMKTFSLASEGGSIYAATLSFNLKTAGFIFIPELRVDNASKKNLFVNNDGNFKKSAASILLAAVYSF